MLGGNVDIDIVRREGGPQGESIGAALKQQTGSDEPWAEQIPE